MEGIARITVHVARAALVIELAMCGVAPSAFAHVGAAQASQEAAATIEPLEIASANGLYRAEVRKAAGQERVADSIARWRLNVYSTESGSEGKALWSSLVPHRAGARIVRLADDGSVLAVVERSGAANRALVRLWGPQGERITHTAASLSLDRSRARSDDASWLADGDDAVRIEWNETPQGPLQFLVVTSAEGAKRWIDLVDGTVRSSPRFETPISVTPDALLAGVNVLASPFVNSYDCASVVYWGEELVVRVSGSHPTPNWRNVGFQFTLGGEDGRTLTLAPMSSPPPANSPQLQVLQGYHATAHIQGLAPGRYILRVDGRGEEDPPERSIEVRRARAVIELHTSGGVLGLDRDVRVFANSVAVVESARPAREREFVVIPAPQARRIEDLLRGAERESNTSSTAVSDSIEHRLIGRIGEREFERRLFDPGAVGAGAELVRLLNDLHH